MYKCKDCDTQYQNKPEYCDCGNNKFDEIVNIDSIDKTKKKQAFFEQYPQIKTIIDSLDVLSTSIFAICIILSILSWIFIGKEPSHSKKTNKTQHNIQKQTKNINIPDIDTIWDNTQPIVETPKIEQPPQSETNFLNNILKRQTSQTHVDVIEPPKPPQAPPPPIVKSTKSNAKAITKNYNSIMNSYKNELRQILFSHLSVTSIQGEGNCEVEFSVDKNGRLINRRFARLSENKSLNDAVYNMLMSVPQFSAPPSEYKGEKIKLTFSFDNGYYEISY